MTQLPTRQTFSDAYGGEAPWDIAGPQPAIAAASEVVKSPVLDAGCGTGENALFFAERGHRVTGVDFLEEAIRRAKAKAAARGLKVDFRVGDALTLGASPERYATVIDSGLFHVFSDDERRRYVQQLSEIVSPGGLVLLQCFSDSEPGGAGPRRVSRREIEEAFADGWSVESIEPTQFQLNPKFDGSVFSSGGPKAWIARVRRDA